MTLSEESVTTQPISLTLPAAQAVQAILQQKNLSGYALRLYLNGGGCSGYQYALALDGNIRPEDTVVETEGIKLVVDEVSMQYLQGATVDYVEGEEASGFRITNPNPITACSCSQGSEPGGSAEGCPGCG